MKSYGKEGMHFSTKKSIAFQSLHSSLLAHFTGSEHHLHLPLLLSHPSHQGTSRLAGSRPRPGCQSAALHRPSVLVLPSVRSGPAPPVRARSACLSLRRSRVLWKELALSCYFSKDASLALQSSTAARRRAYLHLGTHFSLTECTPAIPI